MKSLSKIISLILIMVILLSVFTVIPASSTTNFTNSKGTATVTHAGTETTFSAKDYESRFSKALRKAIEYAGSVATAKEPATVTFTKGNYLFEDHLDFYSNVTLDATGSYIKMSDCIISNEYDNGAASAEGYTGSKNMTIIGGTWDVCGDYTKADETEHSALVATFRFAHCKNVTIKNCTFKNNYSGHDIELGGVNNVKILNCTFKNAKNVNKYEVVGGKEAIQIDINTKKAVSAYPAFDSTPTKNVTVSGCTFKNKFRGVGSHHGAIGKPYTNINIYNNKFDNICGLAVYMISSNNVKVYNNTLTDVGSGIFVSTLSNASTTYNTFNYSYNKTVNTFKKSKSYIYGNTVSVRSKNNNMPYSYGIRADGNHLTATHSTTKIKKGTYYIYGVNIGENTKGKSAPNKVSGDFDCGISLRYTKNAKVANNKVNMNGSTKAKCYGVEVRCSKNAKLLKNTLTNTKRKAIIGVMVSDLNNGVNVSGLTVENNKITSYYKTKSSSKDNYGIRLLNDSDNITIKKNTISSGNSAVCASGYSDRSNAKRKYTIVNNTLNTYADSRHILFREIRLSKTIKNNFTSSKKKCVVDIA